MHFLHVIFTFLVTFTTASFLPSPQRVFSNPDNGEETSYRIPTVHESAVMARRMLRLERIGTLSTILPDQKSSDSHALENRPGDVAGAPFGLMDYFGDCEPISGNPTILALPIATNFKNVAAGSNITLAIRWHPDAKHFYSAASMPRYSLVGYLEQISEDEVEKQRVKECFVKYHPDAIVWTPGNRIHESHWTRLVVQDIYWLGGFGDRAYIGWIPLEEWKNVTQEEIDECKLPGEKKKWRWRDLVSKFDL